MKPDYSPNVVNQTVDFGGTRWKGNPGEDWQAVGNTGQTGLDNSTAPPDPIATAQKFLDFQRKANEPVVQQLQGSKTDLESKYSALVDSIKGAGKVAGDKQTLATSNELGRRGITNDSGLYEQEQANASLPVQTAIASQLANTGLAQSGDLRQLALQIAQLQAGAPSEAIGGALNYGNQVQSANQFSQNLFAQQQQSKVDNEYRDRALAAQSKPESAYTTLSEGQTLYDILGGRALYTNPKTYKPTGGGGGDPY